MSALYELCLRERFHQEDFHSLIAKCHDVDEYRGGSQRTVLHCAVATHNLHLEFIEAVIKAGANVNAIDVSSALISFFKNRIG